MGLKLSYPHGFLVAFILMSCKGSDSQSSSSAPARAAPNSSPAAPRSPGAHTSKKTAELLLLALSDEGSLSIVTESASTLKTIIAKSPLEALQPSRNGQAVVLASSDSVAHYDLEENKLKELAIPQSQLCPEKGVCFVRSLRVSADATRACVELIDGSPSTSSGTITFQVNFNDKAFGRFGPCQLEVDEAPPTRSSDGLYSYQLVESSCGDFCYNDVQIVEDASQKIVKTVKAVEEMTTPSWAPRGSQLLINGVIVDPRKPSFRLKLGSAACWLK